MSKENTESTNTNENVVGSANEKLTMPTLSAPVGSVITTAEVDPKTKTATKPVASSKKNVGEKEEMVAVFSTGTKFWAEVGRLSNGYNIIPKHEADMWLTDPEVRLASPEEIKANLPADGDAQ
jgi:hypothetical protein